MLRSLLLGFIFIALLQLFSAAVISEDQKAERIIEDLKLLMHINHFDSLAFSTNLQVEEDKARLLVVDRFQDTLKSINMCDEIEWNKYRTDPNFFAIKITDSSTSKFFFDSYTSAGTLYYGERWQSQYVWILCRWFKIKHKNIGVS